MEANQIIIKPQEGPQEQFLSCPADIAFYGGAAGGGKTYSLLMDPLRNIHNKHFMATIFRRTMPDIKNPGGLWDSSRDIYSSLGATDREYFADWVFPSMAKIEFAHLEHEKTVQAYQGSQIPYIGFDEVTHFSEKMFFYMLSRNRSPYGIPTRVRGTCNPDADSWVAKFIEWWIDDDGFIDPKKSGKIRHFIRFNDQFHWANNPDDLKKIDPNARPLSFTFISASIFDNKILIEKDPKYLANLQMLNAVDRARLLDGNWKIKPSSGLYFKRIHAEIISHIPDSPKKKTVRYWDKAGTEKTVDNNPDWTAGVKLSKIENTYYVEHVERLQESPGKVEDAVKSIAAQDGLNCKIRISKDPGQAGKSDIEHYVKLLSGYDVNGISESGDKVTRSGPASSQWEHRNIKLVAGQWNEAFLLELENFPSKNWKDDQVDAFNGAFKELNSDNIGEFSKDFVHNKKVNKTKETKLW